MALVRLLSLTHNHAVRHRGTEVRPLGVGGHFCLCVSVCVCVEKAIYTFMLGWMNDEATHLLLALTNQCLLDIVF